MRFDLQSHEYGKRAPSGVMVGYLVGMTVESVQREVNKYQLSEASELPPIRFELPAKEKVMRAVQKLRRKNVPPASFVLHHLWADLRHSKHE
ncbi:MAG: hypothetical protein C4523_09550 [Myxococcales bacterium]|nr:MAG: hypothetical protein C4523_09550 [Myxococcales bacterium]